MSILSQPITLQSVFGSKRQIGQITVDCIISEDSNDTLTITKQPVQLGASISDHAYMEPTVLTMRILQQVQNPITQLLSTFAAAGNSGLAQIYTKFRSLQLSAAPFTVFTPKRLYGNMLISTLRCNTDKNTENILSLDVSFQQVILVNVGTTVQTSPAKQKNPAVTQATTNTGNGSLLAQSTQNAGGTVIPGGK